MVGQTTLSVAIDAKEAKKGAADFIRAADDIKRKAIETSEVVERSKRAFKNMRAEGDQGLGTSGSSDVKIDSIIQEIKRIEKLRESSKFLSLLSSLLPGKLGAAVGIGSTLGQGSLEEQIRALERAKQVIEDDTAAEEFLQAAARTSDPDIVEFLEERASKRLKNAQPLRGKNVAPLLEPLEAQRKLIESFQENSGKNVFLDEFGIFQQPPKILVEGLREKERELADIIAELEARGEAIAFLDLQRRSDANLRVEPTPSEVNAPGSGAFQQDVGDDPLKQQIDETNRSIELLKEQKTAIEDGAAAATAQKEQELQLLQREKECLERLNKALQDNQTLRGLTGDQSDDILEGAAAYDDLSTAIDENGEAAQGLKDQVGSLNTVLQSNADVNSQIVGGLNQEIDARQQVNGAIVERLRLEEEQKQRFAQTQDETERRGKAVEASIEQIKDAAKDSFKDVIKGTESIGDAFQKLADRITDILLDLALDELLKGGTGFSDLFGTIFGGIGSIFGGGAPANLAGPAGIGILPIGHQGGVIGQDRFPLRRFHQGGFPGLRPDEIPIVAQRGEEILARGDPRNAANNNGALGGNVVVNVTFPNARNTDEARQAGSEIAAKAAAAAQRGMVRKGIG